MTTRAYLAMCALSYDAPDRRTSLADLRTAMCLELGVDMADIDPARGTNWSRSTYEASRRSWQRYAAEEPTFWDSPWCERNLREVREDWLKRHPEWDDDWFAPEAAALPAPDPLLIPLFELETTR